MIGRDRVVAEETPSQMWSARWLTEKTAPRLVCMTLPVPATSWREMRKGSSASVTAAKSPVRATRKFSWQP